MNWSLYILLSGMMFLEFLVWGAWGPVLASRLLGTLKMSGKQLGWIYGTLPLACILAPLAAGQIVDKWCPTQWYLGVAHLAGSVFLLIAARAKSFWPMLVAMGLYALCFAPTLALVNSLAFTHIPNPEAEYFRVRVWGSVSWVTAGWLLTAWRRSGKWKVINSDCLIMAGVLSVIMGIYCFFLPHTPPAHKDGALFPFLQALSMLKDTNFLIFLIISFVVTTQLQFYFLGTSRFLEDIGTPHATIPGLMSVAQAAQVVAMAVILPLVFRRIGYQWTLAAATLMWVVMFVTYARMKPRFAVIASMALHGLAYAFFFDAGFIYMNRVAPPEIRASAQALYTTVTIGLGLFAGTQLTGVVMDRCRTESGFRWRPIFLFPCALLTVCMFAFILLFKG
ncbi:MAG: nucleoside permease [Lentisphaerae bacterium]|nr:nucleoside permease [Lentisphaerota bacterium]